MHNTNDRTFKGEIPTSQANATKITTARFKAEFLQFPGERPKYEVRQKATGRLIYEITSSHVWDMQQNNFPEMIPFDEFKELTELTILLNKELKK